MKHSLPISPQFYLTGRQPCPYIKGVFEKKLFTTLDGQQAQSLNDSLSKQGFRRSQNIIYRPNCQRCTQCRSVRILVENYSFSKSEKRILSKNRNIKRYQCAPLATEDQYELFSKYLHQRHHGGGMSEMDSFEFSAMIEESNVHTKLYEYYDRNDKLIAVSITDIISDGLSMVYSFFDVDFPKKSLGKFMILDHIRIAKEIGLKHLYLGYLIEDSPKMRYKAQFSPLEYFANGKWHIYGKTSKNETENLSELVNSLNPILLPESYKDYD